MNTLTAISKVIDGNIDIYNEMPLEKLVERLGTVLDKNGVPEILHDVFFVGNDGIVYTVTIEAVISVASPDKVLDFLDETSDEVIESKTGILDQRELRERLYKQNERLTSLTAMRHLLTFIEYVESVEPLPEEHVLKVYRELCATLQREATR